MTFYMKLETLKAAHPPGYSPLQELYPGRLMPVTEVYDRYNFEPLAPKTAMESFERNKQDTQTYGSHLDEVTLAASPTADKMTYHQVEDPSALIEDPDLTNLNLMQPPAYGDALDVGKEEEDTKPTIRSKEHFGITGTTHDRLFIAAFGLLALLVVVKLSS